MDEVNRKTRSATRHRYALLVVTVLAGCSGGSPLRAVHDGSAAGGGGENWDVPGASGGRAQGGSGAAIGGAGGTGTGGTLGSLGGGNGSGGAADARSTSGTGGASGGATSIDGSSGSAQDGGASETAADAPPDGWCDDAPLWHAIAEGAEIGAGYCMPFVPDYHPSGVYVTYPGYVVFDGDGRVVDNTGLSGAGKQAWLDGLSVQRWPCFAGQTMQYMCVEYPI